MNLVAGVTTFPVPARFGMSLARSEDTVVEQAVVYSTLPQEYSTLTFRGEVVAGGGGVKERSEVMYCIEERTYIYYRVHNGHSCIA